MPYKDPVVAKEYRAKYYQDRLEKFAERNKRVYEADKEKFKKLSNERYHTDNYLCQCSLCGATIKCKNVAYHIKTKKHVKKLEEAKDTNLEVTFKKIKIVEDN